MVVEKEEETTLAGAVGFAAVLFAAEAVLVALTVASRAALRVLSDETALTEPAPEACSMVVGSAAVCSASVFAVVGCFACFLRMTSNVKIPVLLEAVVAAAAAATEAVEVLEASLAYRIESFLISATIAAAAAVEEEVVLLVLIFRKVLFKLRGVVELTLLFLFERTRKCTHE